MWETFTGGQMPYDKMKNVDVVDYVCQSRKRLEQPASCPEKVYQVMLKCFAHVSIRYYLTQWNFFFYFFFF